MDPMKAELDRARHDAAEAAKALVYATNVQSEMSKAINELESIKHQLLNRTVELSGQIEMLKVELEKATGRIVKSADATPEAISAGKAKDAK